MRARLFTSNLHDYDGLYTVDSPEVPWPALLHPQTLANSMATRGNHAPRAMANAARARPLFPPLSGGRRRGCEQRSSRSGPMRTTSRAGGRRRPPYMRLLPVARSLVCPVAASTAAGQAKARRSTGSVAGMRPPRSGRWAVSRAGCADRALRGRFWRLRPRRSLAQESKPQGPSRLWNLASSRREYASSCATASSSSPTWLGLGLGLGLARRPAMRWQGVRAGAGVTAGARARMSGEG